MKYSRLILCAVVAFAGLQPAAKAQTSVNLGSASSFGVLAGAGIVVTGTVGSTTINGDIGTFPTGTVTGFENIALNGVNHADDAVTQQAKTDLLAAFSDAAGRSPTTSFPAIQDLGGLTLTPGVYNDPSSFAITGTLTLDAQGDPNAVWIFQAGSTLTTTGLATAGTSQVLLINGGQAENVFWQVGSSATLAGPSLFVGNVLAFTSITMTSGATVDGGLLAINGVVTLDSDTIDITVDAIPEPAATSLWIAGCVGLVIGVRKIRRRRS